MNIGLDRVGTQQMTNVEGPSTTNSASVPVVDFTEGDSV